MIASSRLRHRILLLLKDFFLVSVHELEELDLLAEQLLLGNKLFDFVVDVAQLVVELAFLLVIELDALVRVARLLVNNVFLVLDFSEDSGEQLAPATVLVLSRTAGRQQLGAVLQIGSQQELLEVGFVASVANVNESVCVLRISPLSGHAVWMHSFAAKWTTHNSLPILELSFLATDLANLGCGVFTFIAKVCEDRKLVQGLHFFFDHIIDVTFGDRIAFLE